jgi:tetraacyldisaccharide 4'-kinase
LIGRSAPDFWWRPRPSASARLLWPLARLWGLGAQWRMARPARFRPPVAVVCVGNFVVGGAGKTPTVIALARLAKGAGLKPGILGPGYGGSGAAAVLVDPARHRAAEVGDEALLLAAAAPTVVARDRAEGARRLLAEGVDLILLDDGFQDPALAKDLSIMAVDAAAGAGNGAVIPMGPLRAPLLAQIRKTDAVLVIGEGTAAEPLVRLAARAGRPVLHASLKAVGARDWQKDKLFAFAGIGRPQKFFDSLGAVGANLARSRGFPDHHVYTVGEANELLTAADIGEYRLVTTEKDAARLAGATGPQAKLRERSAVFAVALEFDNPSAVTAMIAAAVRKFPGH